MKNTRTNANNTNPEVRTDTIRTAIYARCASGLPEGSIATEQIRSCIKYAEKQGWKVAGTFVQTDIGVPNFSLTGCKSLMHLLEAAQRDVDPSTVFWSQTFPAWPEPRPCNEARQCLSRLWCFCPDSTRRI